MTRFQDRVAMVTGAGSGIGQATVARLLEEGAHVLAVDISEPGLAETRKRAEQNDYAARLETIAADISDEAAVEGHVAEALRRTASLDVLVNAAGILRAEHTHKTSLELWNKVLATNLTSTFLMCRLSLPYLLKTGRGVIINFSSTSATFAHPYMAAYAATKGGIQSFTHTIALEYASQGLRAVAVAPGGIETGMTRKFDVPSDVDQSLFARLTPIHGAQMGEPAAVAAAIAMLASDDGRYITGTELRIDGGTHM